MVFTMKQKFTHPAKWRETADPFSLDFHTFQPIEILGYPHAGNDVFHVRGIYNGEKITAYLKIARHRDAALENEARIMPQVKHPAVPKILDTGSDEQHFLVTEEKAGQRLSVILGENEDMESFEYMHEYGAALGFLHQLKIDASPVAERRFFHAPSDELLSELELTSLGDYFSRKPTNITTVFCHGDFHYANILWDNHHISGILDFELSGYGNRDYDIAWAIIRRPGQRFMKTEDECRRFLEGYAEYGSYNLDNICYYMAQIYIYFLSSCGDDEEYSMYIRNWLVANCK